MSENSHDVCELKVELAKMQEKLACAEKALGVSEHSVDREYNRGVIVNNSWWLHAGVVISSFLSVAALIKSFIKIN